MKCEICKQNYPYLQKHHIISKSKGGTNHRLNICEICPNCHSKVHRGDIILEGKISSTAGYILI